MTELELLREIKMLFHRWLGDIGVDELVGNHHLTAHATRFEKALAKALNGAAKTRSKNISFNQLSLRRMV